MTTLISPADRSSPFDNNHADPWAKTFIDLPSLNARVTDAIAAAIQSVRAAARKPGAELRTSSLLVLGPAGAGKTHLFTRLRHKLGPKAVFVHLRPLVGTEMTPRHVLGQIVQQLGYETSQGGLKQLEALVGSSLAQLAGESPDFPRAFIDEIGSLDDARRADKLDAAVETLLERHQEADETYLARLLAAPFMRSAQQRAALAWLAGRELEEAQLKRLGITSSLAEEHIIQALQTLGLFAAPGAPIVLVFDQLENLIDAEATGARVRAYANLVAELFDTMRGYVLVQMALDSEWEQAILPQLSAAQRTRLGGQSEIIDLPTPAQSRELIARWLEHLPDRPEGYPWPFGEKRVTAWAEAPGMTPRMLMIVCRQALALGPDAPFEEGVNDAPSPHRSSAQALDDGTDDTALEQAWEKHLQSARAALDEAGEDRRSADPARLVGGIACALRFANGVTTTRVDARQHLQLLARLGDRAHAVAFLHQTHPRSAMAALERAADALAKSSVLLLRERAIEFPPTWRKVHATMIELLEKGARWITLERDDSAKLLALESFLAAARSRDLEDASGRAFEDGEVIAWIARALRVGEWPVIMYASGEPPDAGDKTLSFTAGQSFTKAIVSSDSGPNAGGASDTGASDAGASDAGTNHGGANDTGTDRGVSSGGVSSRGVSSGGATVGSATVGDATIGAATRKNPTKAKNVQASPAFAGDIQATIRACLGQLRVASLERLVREVVRAKPDATRTEVVTALDAMPDHVRWFGRSLVGIQEGR